VFYGIDISTKKLSIACINNAGIFFYDIECNDKDWLVRFYVLMDDFADYIKDHDVNSIYYIEDVPYVRNKQSYYKLVHIIAGLRLILGNRKYRVIHTNSWKRIVGVSSRGKSKEVKERVRHKCYELFELPENLSQDSCDALLIAFAAKKEE